MALTCIVPLNPVVVVVVVMVTLWHTIIMTKPNSTGNEHENDLILVVFVSFGM